MTETSPAFAEDARKCAAEQGTAEEAALAMGASDAV
jgi:hypothetical protein